MLSALSTASAFPPVRRSGLIAGGAYAPNGRFQAGGLVGASGATVGNAATFLAGVRPASTLIDIGSSTSTTFVDAILRCANSTLTLRNDSGRFEIFTLLRTNQSNAGGLDMRDTAGSVAYGAFTGGEAANTSTIRNTTNAQKFCVLNTYTSTTSWERFEIDWQTTANTCILRTKAGAGGGTLRGLQIQDTAASPLGFWGATPVVQPAATDGTDFTANASANAFFAESTSTGGVGSTAYKFADIVKNLKNAGLIAA